MTRRTGWLAGGIQANADLEKKENSMRKVALITGAGRGIGLGIAQALAAEAHDIVVADIHAPDVVAAALDELRALGATALYCRCDISDAAARATMLREIRATFGRLHVLVNNAGVAPNVRADILEATEESYERVMKINLHFSLLQKLIHKFNRLRKLLHTILLNNFSTLKLQRLNYFLISANFIMALSMGAG